MRWLLSAFGVPERALGLFAAEGIQVFPAATDHEARRPAAWQIWLPETGALDGSGRAMKEWVGSWVGALSGSCLVSHERRLISLGGSAAGWPRGLGPGLHAGTTEIAVDRVVRHSGRVAGIQGWVGGIGQTGAVCWLRVTVRGTGSLHPCRDDGDRG